MHIPVVQTTIFSFLADTSAPAIVIPAKSAHTATVVWLHGLGDTGEGYGYPLRDAARIQISYFELNEQCHQLWIEEGCKMSRRLV